MPNRTDRLLNLRLIGYRQAARTCPPSAHGWLRRTLPNKTNHLHSLAGSELDRQQGFDRGGASIHQVGLEFPLLHGINGAAGKDKRALHELGVLDAAVAANQ